MFYDDAHLNKKGSNRLIDRFTDIPSNYKRVQHNTGQRRSNQLSNQIATINERRPQLYNIGQRRYNQSSHQSSNINVRRPLHQNSSVNTRRRANFSPTYTNYRRDESHHRHYDNRSQRQVTNSDISRFSGCYNCGERNHSVAVCRYDNKIKCFQCNRYGHKATNCYSY